jgi:N-formylglutamate amidohydrolase
VITRRAFVAGVASLAWPGCLLAAESSADAAFVFVQTGAWPIILTAPHGGDASVPGVAPRNVAGKPTRGGSGYVTTQDISTDRLAQGIAAEIKALTRKDVYLVMARFHRRYIDANREPEVAYDAAAAQPIYELYHQSIRRFVDDVRTRFAAGLLIDVHGQQQYPDALVRGTINGRSVSRLIARAGFAAVTGPQGLFGQFERNGFRVLPGNDVAPAGTNENSTGLIGGYTTNRYGSQHPDGIDAVQCEFGTRYREEAELERTIKRAAASIVAFHDQYLK